MSKSFPSFYPVQTYLLAMATVGLLAATVLVVVSHQSATSVSHVFSPYYKMAILVGFPAAGVGLFVICWQMARAIVYKVQNLSTKSAH